MKVPFLDLKAQYQSIKTEIAVAIQEVLDSTAFAGGPFVENFEEEWAAFCGVQHSIGVGSGTEALWLILSALGIGEGHEVITVPNTFIATAEAISYTGATPVFIDVDQEYYTMDPDLIEAAITPQTKAIVPVHIFGQMCDMESIVEIANRHGLSVVEDACQAHGAMYKGRMAGSIGCAAAFSFYPGKNLGAYGDAGAVCTNDDKLAETIRKLRDHGQSKKYHHDLVGWNARMDGFQGAILSVKLRHLESWTAGRRQCAKRYEELLAGSNGIVIPKERPGCKHVYHLYVVRVNDRDSVTTRLREMGIGTGIHYPIPVNRQICYHDLVQKPFPISDRYADEIISLPMFAELNMQDLEFVCKSLFSGVLSPIAAVPV